MPKDSSAKYYPNNKEKHQKRAREKYQSLSKYKTLPKDKK